MAQIDITQAQKMRDALGADCKWRLAYADDQRFSRNQKGHWHEKATAQRKELQALSDQYSWHLRPEPVGGPYQHTMLDDASQETIDRLKAEGLPPTAIVQTSEGCYQVWHRWPKPMNRGRMKVLLQHLQSHYGTDQGANMPGHCGRLAGSRNWKRDPEKGINRRGYPVSLVEINPPLRHDQAKTWLDRYPIPKPEPKPSERPNGTVNNFDFDDLRYQKILSNGLQKLPQVWRDNFALTKDASSADMSVANRAVSLQLSDSATADILSGFVQRRDSREHVKGQGYIPLTIKNAREYTGVISPGVWSSKFDAVRQFPYLETQKSKSRERDPEAER